MKHAFAIILLASGTVAAQDIPRAQVVDPALIQDAGNDFFLRGKNLYDAAQSSTSPDSRRDFFQRAGEIFAEYLNAFPNHPNAEMAWWYLGNSYYQNGQIDDGKRCFSTLLNRYAGSKWAAAAAYTLAADYYNKTEYAFAAPLFERFAENAHKPEDRPKGYYLAGNCYRLLGRDREANGLFKKVLEDPAGGLYAPQAKVALGNLAVKVGKFPEALALFQEVISSTNTPKIRGEAALQGALAATKLGQTEEAEKYLQLILTTPGMENYRLEAQTALMANLFARKEYSKVIDAFRRSETKAEGEQEAARLMIVARSYLQLKQPSDALQHFRDVEKLVKPQNTLAFEASYYRLLCFYQIEGKHIPEQVDAFLQLYKKSRSEDPRIHTALVMKAESLMASQETAAAAKVYGQVNAALLNPDIQPSLFYNRGWCLSEAGDAQGAVRSFTDFIGKFPKDPRISSALAKRGKAYAESAESAKAIADFDALTSATTTPEDLNSFAWLESARLRRAEPNIPDMIVRYQGLLKNSKTLSPSLEAEAHYFIGWGLVKNNTAKEAVPYLEKARKLRPQDYRKHAGLLLAIGYFASQDAAKLAGEIDLAIKGGYASDLPDQAVQWSGMQSYNAGDYAAAAKSLALVSNPEEPRETAKEVWRYLAKARLESGDAEGALKAANHVLAVEENTGWRADGLLDRGRALLALKGTAEARKDADAALALHPQGHTLAGLNILDGDLHLEAGDAKTAAGKYQIVVQFHEDKLLKPLALSKLIAALEKQSDAAGAEKYRQQLKLEFPDWKPTAP